MSWIMVLVLSLLELHYETTFPATPNRVGDVICTCKVISPWNHPPPFHPRLQDTRFISY